MWQINSFNNCFYYFFTLQDNVKWESTVFLLRDVNNAVEIDISRRVSPFKPTLFLYMWNIRHLDVSGCTSIDPDLFSECVVSCKNLQELDMISCPQFNEMHLVKMSPNMQNVCYLDVQSCNEMSFDAIFSIIMEMQHLLCINFDPKNPVCDILYWELLLWHFKNIQFGHSVRCKMPHYGNWWRIPGSSHDDDLWLVNSYHH